MITVEDMSMYVLPSLATNWALNGDTNASSLPVGHIETNTSLAFTDLSYRQKMAPKSFTHAYMHAALVIYRSTSVCLQDSFRINEVTIPRGTLDN